jgi:phosphatidylinositol alpha-1,6-mannosyltransferase
MLYISSEFPPGPGGIGQHTASLLKVLPEKQRIYLLTNQDYCKRTEAESFNGKELKSQQFLHLFISRSKKLYSLRRFGQAICLVFRTRPKRVIVSGRFPLWLGG